MRVTNRQELYVWMCVCVWGGEITLCTYINYTIRHTPTPDMRGIDQ